MQIRKAFPQDMTEIKRLARDVIRHNYTPYLGIDATSFFIESGMSDKEIEEGIGSCILLEKGNKTIAFSITKENLLHLIMVDVPFQNSGYGEALLSYIEAEMFSRYERICLQTFKENIAAARFYAKHGWQIIGQTWIPEMGATMIRYEKVK